MQLLLNERPEIATAPETQIFAYYLDAFRRQWRVEHEGPAAKEQGGAGLSRLLSEEEFRDLVRENADFVMARIHQRRPSARIVAEKSPRHALLARWILEVYPEAFILHVLRDPRDTVASILEAGWSWGRGWAPRHPVDASRLWVDHVKGARAAAEVTSRYLEVRYEDLRADPAKGLSKILEGLRIEHTREECVHAAEACDLDRLRSGSDTTDRPTPGGQSPTGFFGKGRVGSWEARLGKRTTRIVEWICAEEMREAGYEPSFSRSKRTTASIRLHDLIARSRESIDWQLQKLLWRI